jgi:hypothetical protein
MIYYLKQHKNIKINMICMSAVYHKYTTYINIYYNIIYTSICILALLHLICFYISIYALKI